MYFQMFLAGTFIDEVSLNYDGLTIQEKQWYHQGVAAHLREVHEELIIQHKVNPEFEIQATCYNHVSNVEENAFSMLCS